MCDSDSDSDTQTGVFAFRNHSTSLSGKGPNINLTNLNLQNSMLTSTMNMPWNRAFDRRQYSASLYDQRSMYSRRETSPMSMYSASDMQSRNMLSSFHSRGMSSHRSMYNGRGGSPFSVRTVDSNTSVSAVDIAAAFKTMHFNKNDMRIIKDAYNKYMKYRMRKRIEKRRNLRRFMKGARRKSGGDSGEQGSDSSLSSDGCQSTRSYRSTIPRKNNMSSCRTTRADLEDFRKTLHDSNMYRDCTSNFKQNRFRNMLPNGPRSIPETFTEKPQNQPFISRNQSSILHNQSERFQNQSLRIQNQSGISQKERFTSGFLLPSQRFNQSTLVPISEKTCRPQRSENNKVSNVQAVIQQKEVRDCLSDSESEQEEIFSRTVIDNSQNIEKSKNKRRLEDSDIMDSENKRTKKLETPIKKKAKTKPAPPKLNRTLPKNDFVFVKPQLPVKKLSNKSQSIIKNQISSKKSPEALVNTDTQQSKVVVPELIQNTDKEKPKNCKNKQNIKPQYECETRISKCQHLPEINISHSRQDLSMKPVEQLLAKSSQPLDKENDYQNNDQTISETTDMSVRPSFIKRKLFSQKIDMGDNKNSSSDCIEGDNSPNDVYSEIQKEKNKTRKLVTSQSYLNRDALRDESNLLDLIQKIVPSERLNVTTAINRSEIKSNNKQDPATKKPEDTTPNKDSSFKVDEVIASCDNTADMSDTYTDEEIFKCNENNTMEITAKINDKNNEKKPKRKSENYNKNNIIKRKPNDNVALKKTADKHEESTLKCKVVIEKIPINKSIHEYDATNAPNKNPDFSRNVYQSVKSFWDTDIDSDIENCRTPLKNPYSPYNPKQAPSSTKRSASKEKISPIKKSTKLASTKSTITSTTRTQSVTAKLNSNTSPTEKNNRHPNKSKEQKLANGIPSATSKLNSNTSTIEKYNKHSNKSKEQKLANGISSATAKFNSNISPTEKNNRHTNKSKEQKLGNAIPSATAQLNSNTSPTEKNNKKPKKTIDQKHPNNIPCQNLPKLNATKTKNNKITPDKNIKKPKKANTKIILDNNLSNNTSQNKLETINKNKRERTTRTPRVKLCCTEPRKNDNSLDDSTDTVYRHLRGRTVNLTTSTTSDCSPIPAKRITIRHNTLAKLSKNKDDSESDLSFTLTSNKVNQFTKNGNMLNNTRQSERLSRTKDKLNASESSNNLSANCSTRMCLRNLVSKQKKFC